jgi:hypothetical protein
MAISIDQAHMPALKPTYLYARCHWISDMIYMYKEDELAIKTGER